MKVILMMLLLWLEWNDGKVNLVLLNMVNEMEYGWMRIVTE
jgi:hypothetical protein